MNKLLACPFCGSDQVGLIEDRPTAMSGSIVTYAYVECRNCKAHGPLKDDWDNEKFREQAVDDWNARW